MTKLFKFILETTNRTDYGQTIKVIIGWSFINIANHGISFIQNHHFVLSENFRCLPLYLFSFEIALAFS